MRQRYSSIRSNGPDQRLSMAVSDVKDDARVIATAASHDPQLMVRRRFDLDAQRLSLRIPTHRRHLGTHAPTAKHVHPYAPILVGLLHGAAGTMEIFVLIPISLMASRWLAYSYMALFSAGCVASMSGYGYFAGRLYGHANLAGQQLYRIVVVLTSAAGLALGVIWIARNL